MKNYDEFFVKIAPGSPIHLHDGSNVQSSRTMFEYMRWMDGRLIGSSHSYKTFAVEIEDAIFLPILRARADRDLQATIVQKIDAQKFQQVILNLPRVLYNPRLGSYMSWEECLQAFPNLCQILADVMILSQSEAGACLRDYRSGLQFSGEAVSHSGGTPLDAIVRSVVSASQRVGNNDTLTGAEIIATCFDSFSGTLDLTKLERWCEFLWNEWELLIKNSKGVA